MVFLLYLALLKRSPHKSLTDAAIISAQVSAGFEAFLISY